jgi:hypothetical protein
MSAISSRMPTPTIAPIAAPDCVNPPAAFNSPAGGALAAGVSSGDSAGVCAALATGLLETVGSGDADSVGLCDSVPVSDSGIVGVAAKDAVAVGEYDTVAVGVLETVPVGVCDTEGDGVRVTDGLCETDGLGDCVSMKEALREAVGGRVGEAGAVAVRVLIGVCEAVAEGRGQYSMSKVMSPDCCLQLFNAM